MTDHELLRIRKLSKTMKHRHPFKWKKWKDHVSIVMYVMDALDELDGLVYKAEFPVLHMTETEGVNIIKHTGRVLQAINLWKQSPLFHQFLQDKVDDLVADMVNGTYEYVQTMCNLVVADMNKTLIEYIEALKDEILRRSREEFEENEIDEDIDIKIVDDLSPDAEAKGSQFVTIIRLRNEATAKRIIARNYIASVKSVLYYDYIDIIRGVDIISKMKHDNKSISKTLGKRTIKFVDLKAMKGDTKK